MRIAYSCLLTNFDNIGGLQIRLKALITRLLERGHSIIIAQTPYSYEKSRKFYIEMKGYDLEPLIIGDIRSDYIHISDMIKISTYKTLEKINGKVDIVDSFDSYLRIPRKRKYALVFSNNGYMEYFLLHYKYVGIRFLILDLIRNIMSQRIIYEADMLIAENELQRNMLMRLNRIPLNKTAVILPGYDKKLALQITGADENKRKHILLFSGRMIYSKGIFELILAFKAINLLFPQWQLYLIGDGPDKFELNTLIRKLNLEQSVVLFGEKSYEENLSLMNLAEIIILPSYIEGVPLSLIEGMALGKSVIATNVGGISTHLIEDHKNGILIKPKDIRSLTDAIKLLIEDDGLRNKLAKNAKEKTFELSFDEMAEETLNAYSKALEVKSYEKGNFNIRENK